MNKLSYKYKIMFVIVAFAIFMLSMFMFGYNTLNRRNEALANTTAQLQLEYEVLQREEKNFQQGKKDIATLGEKRIPPNELFSKDTRLVKEIKALEETASKYGVQLKLAISGTTKSAVKVPGAASELFSVPYTVTLEGKFDDVAQYIQAVEHLSFVTATSTVDITALTDNTVRASLYSEFYLKK